jgi:hypothetical protein
MSNTRVIFAAIFLALFCVYAIVAIWRSREADAGRRQDRDPWKLPAPPVQLRVVHWWHARDRVAKI